MSQLQEAQSQVVRAQDDPRRSLFLFGGFGERPWNRDLLIRESQESGLQVVVAKLASDKSESLARKAYGISDDGAATQAHEHATEVLPADITSDLLERLRDHYGEDWCVLPLNDYVAGYAAAICARHSDSCYPPASAEVVKRKHMLRALWNQLAAEPDSKRARVEYCYVEQRETDEQFDCYPSAGYEALPEETPLIVKPDELSSSIEVHQVSAKAEAREAARLVCERLRTRWAEVGKSIGTEVRPRVVIEQAIGRAGGLHPGAEYSVEFVSHGGRHRAVGVTQKWVGPSFIEAGHLFPAETLPGELRPAVEGAVEEMLGRLGVRYCVSHWEFIVTPGGQVALVEGHLRAAGDRIMELVEHSTGRCPTRALCEALAGRGADFRFEPREACGVFWMVPRRPLASITHVEAAKAGEGCVDLYLNHEGITSTQNWSRATDWISRFAHVMMTGADSGEVLERCREVARGVRLVGVGEDGRPAETTLKLAIDE
jgi:hypothetical protein